VHPGCSMPARTYSWEQYVEVVERLVKRRGARVILTGTAAESDLIERIFNRLGPTAQQHTIRAAGVLPFPEFCALIDAADVVITNNTGPMHVAAAVKTPVVVLFALTNPPEQWHPWRVEHRLLYHDVPCRLCYSRVCPVGHECLRLVTADDVVSAAEDLLAVPTTPHSASVKSNKRQPATPARPHSPGFPRPVRKIAVMRALHLGDLLCSTPALRALRQQFPDAEITLIGLPWARELINRLPTIDRLDHFPGYPGLPEVRYEPLKTREFIEAARRRRYDLVVQMHGCGPASNDFVTALGGAMTLGFSRDAYTRLAIGLPWREDEHEVLRWLRLVGELGAETSDTHLEFPLEPHEFARAEGLLDSGTAPSRSLIGLHPGAKDSGRRWPVARFSELAAGLSHVLDCRFVLTGTASEEAMLTELTSRIDAPVLNLGGQTDLGTLAAVIARLDLLVTNDTGASHVAAAVGTPSVILFGPTSPARWAPLNRHLHHPLDAKTITGMADGVVALAQLPVEPIFDTCCELLTVGRSTVVRSAFAASRANSALEVICGD
ncbi:MAG TPA: glycosyltransferase family 9 protein, partial [Thermomicrobiales bacterium]|nr:glycosyltransferase family 9 protein [Thermomicrobiales bacterium]